MLSAGTSVPTTAYAGIGTVIGAIVAFFATSRAARWSFRAQQEVIRAQLQRDREERYFEKRATVYAELISLLLSVKAFVSYHNEPEGWKYNRVTQLAQLAGQTVAFRGSIQAFASDAVLSWWEPYERIGFRLRDEANAILSRTGAAGEGFFEQEGKATRVNFRGPVSEAFDNLLIRPVQDLLAIAKESELPTKSLIEALRLELQGKIVKPRK